MCQSPCLFVSSESHIGRCMSLTLLFWWRGIVWKWYKNALRFFQFFYPRWGIETSWSGSRGPKNDVAPFVKYRGVKCVPRRITMEGTNTLLILWSQRVILFLKRGHLGGRPQKGPDALLFLRIQKFPLRFLFFFSGAPVVGWSRVLGCAQITCTVRM